MAKTDRPSRATIDDKMLGAEPAWNVGEVPTDLIERKLAYINASKYYNYLHSPTEFLTYVFDYAKELGYTPEQIKIIKRCSDAEIGIALGHQCKLYYRGWTFTDEEIQRQRDALDYFYREGLKIVEELEDTQSAPVISIAERTRKNVMNTIANDWDHLIDQWCQGKYTQTFNAYELFKKHNLKQNAVGYFEEIVRSEYELIKDAYDKKCEQAVEAYEHVSRPFLKKMLQLMEGIFTDLESIKTAAKQARTPRAKKPKPSDKQVAKLKYKAEDITSKTVSINPVMIPGATRLYVYNTKNRKLFEYTCTAVGGFVIQGSTIKNFDQGSSRSATLRKPEDVLPDIMKKSVKQIDKIWGGIKTKVTVPNGRINEDCILLRVVR